MATSTPTILRVFLDSSVFFAATYSAKGSARDLLLATIQGRIALALSAYVIDETERNVLKRAPLVHPDFLHLRDISYTCSAIPRVRSSPTRRESL